MVRFLSALCLLISGFGFSNERVWENPDNPIYNPYENLSTDYCPSIAYDRVKALYKLWHEGPNGIALSTSQDGIHWRLTKETTLQGTHPVVIYDEKGFEDGKYFYKIWYWTGVGGKTVDVIHYAQSMDGENWSTPLPIQQDKYAPLVFGEGFFANLYGPGFLLYNDQATSKEGEPYSFPYVMFYDAVSGGANSSESIGLAYSQDGVIWKRHGDPILLPSPGWDATNVFRPFVIKIDGLFHMLYSGSNEHVAVGKTVPYGHGIGHAVSKDGIEWVKDARNPLMLYADGVEWRSGRTYRPLIVPSDNKLKLWFVGGEGGEAGKQQGIGYGVFDLSKFTGKR